MIRTDMLSTACLAHAVTMCCLWIFWIVCFIWNVCNGWQQVWMCVYMYTIIFLYVCAYLCVHVCLRAFHVFLARWLLQVAARWWRQTAQTIRTPCLLAGWSWLAESHSCKICTADFPGGGSGNSRSGVGIEGGEGGSSRRDRPQPYTGGSWGGGRAWLDGRGPGTKTQPLLWRGRGWGAGGGGGLLLRRLAGLSSVVAPDRGLACGAAGNWQKMAHASSTQCSLAKNSNWPIYNTPSDTGGTDPAI